ncbi:MAG: beta-propeller domain-containing protein [Candidatus Schekmanbacteria bacterium]|nr:beta-propeller domain-containing protein [Candidatus Schekmanbacteria bacterium]
MKIFPNKKFVLFVIVFIALAFNSFGAGVNIKSLGFYGGTTDYNDVVVSGSYAYVATSNGLIVFNVSNPSAPTKVGTYGTQDRAISVFVSSNTLYLLGSSSGLMIFDVSDPSSPVLLGSYDTPGSAQGVYVLGTKAYIADGSSGLQIIDVSNPSSPLLLGTYDTPGSAWGVYVLDTRAYVADYTSGLQIIDVSVSSSPILVGTYDTPGQANSVYVLGSTAYVADGTSGLQIIGISDISSPRFLGSYNPSYSTASEVYVSGTMVYLAYKDYEDYWAPSRQIIIDVSNPYLPAEVSSYDTPGTTSVAYVLGTTVYVACGGGYYNSSSRGLQIIDVSDVSNPVLSGSYIELPGKSNDVYVSGETAYVSDDKLGFQIIDVSNPTSPVSLGSIYSSVDGVSVSANTAYVVGDFGYGLNIIDMLNPASLVFRGSYDMSVSDLSVSGNIVYAVDGESALQVIDVSDPSTPLPLGSYFGTHSSAQGLYVSGNIAYVSGYGLEIIDVSNPASLVFQGSYDTTAYLGYDVFVSGTTAYVAGSGGLRIMDVSDPTSIEFLGSYAISGWANDIYVSGTTAYVAVEGDYSLSGLQIIDVSDPSSPKLLGTYNTPGDARKVFVSGSKVYIADGSGGLRIIKVSNIEANFPDLTVTNIKASKTLKKGNSYFLTATVKNKGKAAAEVSGVDFYLSKNNNKNPGSVSSDIWINSKSIKALKKGKSAKVTLKWKVPMSVPKGKYYIKAFCDSGSIIVEENENNNVGVTGKVTVK